MKRTWQWLVLIFVVVALFNWRIVFTRQFSNETNFENASQTYAYLQYATNSVRHGTIPLWNPYSFSGHPLPGEAQPGVFDPLHAFFYVLPMNRDGVIPVRNVHFFTVLVHILAACLLFFVARRLGLPPFPAFVAGLCYSLGGFMIDITWLDMLDSAVWLPLVFWFALRAFEEPRSRRAWVWAAVAGLFLGLAVLAGRLHMVIMDGIAVAGAGVWYAATARADPDRRSLWKSPWAWSAAVVAVVAVVGFCVGAVQMLPSMQYSHLSVRWTSAPFPLASDRKIPYAYMGPDMPPHAIAGLLFGYIGASEFKLYFGILPLLLALIGSWFNWHRPLVRYLSIMACVAVAYSFGAYSLINGVAYALIPYMWIAREGTRLVYLTHFAEAILAGYGLATVLSPENRAALQPVLKMLKWPVAVLSAIVVWAALTGTPVMHNWAYFSFIMMLASAGVLALLIKGHTSRGVCFLAVLLILSDLYGYDWHPRLLEELKKDDSNHMARLISTEGAANFIKAQPGGPFRVAVRTPRNAPNLGPVFGVQTVLGHGATMVTRYERLYNSAPRASDLLGVRYYIEPAGDAGGETVYTDNKWKVTENQAAFPRGWLVHQVQPASNMNDALAKLNQSGFDAHNVAVVETQAPPSLEPKPEGAEESVTVEDYAANHLRVRVKAASAALLVLSENVYPGWKATLNGADAPIVTADVTFRAVRVPAGESVVEMRFRPKTVLAGGILSLLSIAGVLIAAFVILRRHPAPENAITAEA